MYDRLLIKTQAADHHPDTDLGRTDRHGGEFPRTPADPHDARKRNTKPHRPSQSPRKHNGPHISSTTCLTRGADLVTFTACAVVHFKTRRVRIAGITPSPNATRLTQLCRDLTDCEDGALIDATHLMVDRDTSFIATRDFLEQNTGTEVVLLPPKSPNVNASMGRWFRSLKSEV